MEDKENRVKQNNLISPYSEEELEYFRQIILKKRKETVKELKSLKNTLNDGSVGSAYSSHMADMGSEAQEREKKYVLCNRLEKFVRYLDGALQRIDDKTYGICKKTGKKISKGRLEAVPHTQLSIEAKQKQ